MINNIPDLAALHLQRGRNGVATGSPFDSLGPQDSSIKTAELLTALAALPMLAAQATPVAASAAPAPLTNERVRPIIFTPLIDGASPLESLPIYLNEVDFEKQEDATAHVGALKRARERIILSLRGRSILDGRNLSSKYDNNALGNRYIDPVAFAITVQGKPFNMDCYAYAADFQSASDAYSYTARLLRAHTQLLERAARRKATEQNVALAAANHSSAEAQGASASAGVVQPSQISAESASASAEAPNAPASAGVVQPSQISAEPASASAEAPNAPASAGVVQPSQISAEPASASAAPAPANSRNDEFNAKTSGYTREENPCSNGIVVVEKWLNGHQQPPHISNGFDPQTYNTGTHKLRITTIRANGPAPAPESPFSPLSPKTPDTPPRSLSSAPNAAVTASKVVTKPVVKLEEGLLMITQEWPVGIADPDFPEELPKGYEVTTVTEDKVNNVCIRTLILQETTIPAFADNSD